MILATFTFDSGKPVSLKTLFDIDIKQQIDISSRKNDLSRVNIMKGKFPKANF